MGIFSSIGTPPSKISGMGAIPKDSSAFQILQRPQYGKMGDVSWTTGETWGILMAGAVVGVVVTALLNGYYK